jgi:hypothetical protein
MKIAPSQSIDGHRKVASLSTAAASISLQE